MKIDRTLGPKERQTISEPCTGVKVSGETVVPLIIRAKAQSSDGEIVTMENELDPGDSWEFGVLVKEFTITNTVSTQQDVVIKSFVGRVTAQSLTGTVNSDIVQAGSITENTVDMVNADQIYPVVAANSNRKAIHIRNTGSDVVYLGGAGVATGGAVDLLPGEVHREEAIAAAAWYAISSTAGQALAVLEAE